MSTRMLRVGAMLVVLCSVASQAHSQSMYRGHLGVRYEMHDYTGAPSGLASSDVLRQMFLHSVDFVSQHRIKQGRIGTVSLGLSLDGYYDYSRIVEEANSNYYSPDLRNLEARIALVPQSRITMNGGYASRHSYELSYENKNRFVVSTERPVLTVVRKYENRQQTLGASARASVSSKLQISGTYEDSKGTLKRLYDFQENRDIFSEVVPQQLPSPQSEYFILFSNNLPESVSVFMDDTLVVSQLEPEGTYLALVSAGLHRFTIAAISYNSFDASYDVDANLTWLIRYNSPVAPNDRDVARTNSSLTTFFKPSEHLENVLDVRIESSDDGVSLSRSSTQVVSNMFEYRAGDRFGLRAQTSYNRLGTASGDRPEDVQRSFGHTTSLDLVPDTRTTLLLSHAITQSSQEFSSTLINSLEAGGKRQFSKRYSADMRARGSRLAGDGGLTRQDMSVRAAQQFVGIRAWGTTNTLVHDVDWKRATQSTRDKAEGQYGTRLSLQTDLGEVGGIGRFNSMVGRSLQWLVDQTGRTQQSGVSMGLALSNERWTFINYSASLQHMRTETSGGGTQAGRAVSNTSGQLSVRLQLGARTNLNGTWTLQDQKGLDSRTLSLSLTSVLPYLGAAYRADWSVSSKTFAQLGTEENSQFIHGLRHAWRSLVFRLEHSIIFERLRTGSARYQSVRIEAGRRFSL